MAGRPLRKALAALLAASLAAPACAVEVKVPAKGRSGAAGGASGVATGAVPRLSLDLGGLIKAVPGAPAPALDERHIVFDVRGSRGGHGDVAAAYLTAFDLLDRTQGRKDAITPRITFIAEKTERGILSRLSGQRVSDGGSLFDGRIQVYSARTLPARHPPADVLMSLASADGEFERRHDLRWVDGSRAPEGLIPVTERSVILTQTVFGNTESSASRPATALVGGHRLELSHAGPAAEEAGVYADPVARALRGRPRAMLRRYLLAQAEETDVPGAAALAAVVRGGVLEGAEVGLAYGISLDEVKPQFERYLEGLAARAEKEGGSYAVFTPSSFSPRDVKSRRLRERVVVVDGDRPLPERARPGTIYVLKTGTLPHPLFVGLMAYSRPPPVLAGDGAMSAALALGRPFVMTRIEWNERNVGTFAQRLYENAPPKARELISDVYLDLALERALELEDLAPAFAKTSRAIPSLTDTLLAAAQAARAAPSTGVSIKRLLKGLKDEVLKASLVALRSMLGEEEARDLAWDLLRRGSPRARRAVASALVRNAAGRAAVLRPLRALNFHPVNVVAARLALRLSAAADRRRSG